MDAAISDNHRIYLWAHDNVCDCEFAESHVRCRMSVRFHERNHTREICRETLNPNTPAICKVRYRFGCANASASEQLFRHVNRQSTAQRIGKLNYRAFWRRACMFYNASVQLRASQSRIVTHPAISKQLQAKTAGGTPRGIESPAEKRVAKNGKSGYAAA